MNLFERIIRYMTIIILSPFKLINHICEKSKDSDILQSIITIVGVSLVSFTVVVKMWPLNDGRWIIAGLIILIFSSIIVGVILFSLKFIVEAFGGLTNIPAEIFDKSYEALENVPTIIGKQVNINNKSKNNNVNQNKSKGSKERVRNKYGYFMREEEPPEHDLHYFIEIDVKNNKIPYLKYISKE